MVRKLSDSKVEEMFAAYTEKQTLGYVSRKCQVSHITVKRYRDMFKWDERVEKIKKRTIEKVDARRADHRARHAQLGKLLQIKGATRLQNMPEHDIDGRLAKDLIKDGVTIEREALGDYTPDVVIRLDLPDDIDL